MCSQTPEVVSQFIPGKSGPAAHHSVKPIVVSYSCGYYIICEDECCMRFLPAMLSATFKVEDSLDYVAGDLGLRRHTPIQTK